MWFPLLCVALLSSVVSGQRFNPIQQEVYGPPAPYQYAYSTQDVEGSSSAEQTSDGSGRIVGKYTIALADGRQRLVTYWADASGFHADVVTNELGTESKNPADVTIQSSAVPGPEAAIKYESTRIRDRGNFGRPIPLAPAAIAQSFAALKPVAPGIFRKS